MRKMIGLGIAGLCLLTANLKAAELTRLAHPLRITSTRMYKFHQEPLRVHAKIIRESKLFDKEMGEYISEFTYFMEDFDKLKDGCKTITAHSVEHSNYLEVKNLLDKTRKMTAEHYSCFKKLIKIVQKKQSLDIEKIEEMRKYISANVHNVRSLKEGVRLSRHNTPGYDYFPFVLVATNNTKMALMGYELCEIIEARQYSSHE